MPFWPFKKSRPEKLTPVELRDKLIETAATGSRRKLRAVCQQYKDQVAQNLEVIGQIPEGMSTEDHSIDGYVQCLGAVAHCLANDCAAPELWDKLCGNPDDNPLVQWERWYGELPRRMERLEYEALIDEAKGFIEKAKTLRGGAARQQEAILFGRLGELLFHSGRPAEAVKPFESAFDLCTEGNDAPGQIAHLSSLLEVHRYLDDGLAVPTAERLLDLQSQCGAPTGELRKRIGLLRTGEPLCRVVCVRDGQEHELDEVTSIGQGSYQFLFRRNRLSLQKSITLTQQGNRLASSGELSEALEKYHEASEIDPHDPDPIYQSGMCLLELGAYGQAREAFDDVERLAPAWFRCRSDSWLAAGLEEGTISDEEFRLLRILEDGGLEASQAQSVIEQALERFPEFAPFYLLKGDLDRKRGESQKAALAYRRGLELVEEPDLESRLLCALAGILPPESSERLELVERAVKLDGSLVAQATAKLIGRQER